MRRIYEINFTRVKRFEQLQTQQNNRRIKIRKGKINTSIPFSASISRHGNVIWNRKRLTTDSHEILHVDTARRMKRSLLPIPR